MNQTDFFLLYLNLTNRKAINNYLVNSKQVKQALLQKPNLVNYQKLGFVEISFLKEALALLAFSGLRKTIAIAEWKNPFGSKSKEIFNNHFSENPCRLPRLSESVSLFTIRSSLLTKEKSLSNTTHNLLPVQTLGLSNGFYPTCFKATSPFESQSLEKIMALVRFKKTLNPFSTKKTKISINFRSKLPKISKLRAQNKFAVKQQNVGATLLKRKARGTSNEVERKFCYYGAKNSEIGFRKQATQLISKKFLTLFNQRLLSQSFKYNFIQHLKNCESLIGLDTGLFPSRKDHKMSLTPWTPAFDFHGLLSSYGTKASSGRSNNEASFAFAQKFRASGDQSLEIGNEAANYGPYSRLCSLNQQHYLTYPNTALPQKNRACYKKTNALNCSQSKGFLQFVQPVDRSNCSCSCSKATTTTIGQAFWFGKNTSFFALPGVKSKMVTSKKASLQPMFNKVLADTDPLRRLEDSLNKVERDSLMAKASLVKELFSSTKKESLLASAALTKFYTASWLLEYIQAELSLRNANIKRVLNQTFLLTQQPLFDSTKKGVIASSYKAASIKDAKTWLKQSPYQQDTLFSKRAPADLKKVNKLSLATMLKESVCFNSTETLVTLLNNRQYLGDMQSNGDATIMPYLIKGLRISFSGRLGGKKGMAKTLTKTVGVVPLSTLKEKVDFAKGVVQTKAGSLGVKVWICYN